MPDLNVHIIQLVRDPRGVVNSLSKLESNWGLTLTPTKVCLSIRNDIEASHKFTEHPRFLRVRFVSVPPACTRVRVCASAPCL